MMLCLFVLCATLTGTADIDEVFADIGPAHSARGKLNETLNRPAGEGAELLYRGLINRAITAGQQLRAEREFCLAGQKDRKEATLHQAVRLTLALDHAEDCLDNASAALKSADLDTLGWLVATRAVLCIADSAPTRKNLAPLPPDTEPRIAAIHEKLRTSLLISLERGLALRESAFAQSQAGNDEAPAARSAPAKRDAVRQYVKASLRLLRDTEAAAEASATTCPQLKEFRAWLDEDDIHPPRQGMAALAGPVTLGLEFTDVLALAPWPYGLAERLGIGKVEASLTAINVEASSEKPPLTLTPSAVVDLSFVLKPSNERRPITTLRLRGGLVDSLTLGDEALFRGKLKNLLPVDKKQIADLPNIADVIAQAPAALPPNTLDVIRQSQANAAVGNLAQTVPAAQVVSAAFPEVTFNRECFWLLRSQTSLSTPVAASVPAPPPGEPAPPLEFASVEWRRARKLVATFLDDIPPMFEETELAVALIHQSIEQTWKGIEDEIRNGLLGASANADARKALSDAQRGLEAANVASIAACDIRPLAALEAAVAHLRKLRRQRESAARLAIPTFLSPDRRFHRAGSTELDIPASTPVRVRELLALWSKAEMDLQAAGTTENKELWAAGGRTLADAERQFVGLFGAGGLTELVALHAIADHWVTGLIAPAEAAPTPPTPGLAMADLKNEEAELAFAADARKLLTVFEQVESLRLTLLELGWLAETQLITTDDATWQAFVKRVRPPDPAPAEGQQAAPAMARPTDLPWPEVLENRTKLLTNFALNLSAGLDSTVLNIDSVGWESIDSFSELQQIRAKLDNFRTQLLGFAPGMPNGIASNWRSEAVQVASLTKDQATFLARKGGVGLNDAQFVFAASRVAAAACDAGSLDTDRIEAAVAWWIDETAKLTNAKVDKRRAMRMAWESVAIEGVQHEPALEFRWKLLKHANPDLVSLGYNDRRMLGSWYLEIEH